MYKASARVALPTSIIGSLPRPSWYTVGLGAQSFLEATLSFVFAVFVALVSFHFRVP